MKNVILAAFAALLLTAPALAYTHPAQGHKPNPVRAYQTSDNSDWSRGDLTFASPKDMPAPSSLTDMERYMLAGTKDSQFTGGYGLGQWTQEVSVFATKFYSLKGYLPDQLTPQLIRSIPEWHRLSDAQVDVLRNPLTGEWPRLKAARPSPGDAYIRPLTDEEVKYFAGKSIVWHKEWIEHKDLDIKKLQSGASYSEAYARDIYPVHPILYTRFYGYKGVIENGFWYTMMEVQPHRDMSHLWDKQLSSPLR